MSLVVILSNALLTDLPDCKLKIVSSVDKNVLFGFLKGNF